MKSKLLYGAFLGSLASLVGCEELNQAGGNGEAPQAGATPVQQVFVAPDLSQPARPQPQSQPAAVPTPEAQPPQPAPTVTSTEPAPDAAGVPQPGDPGVEKATAGVGKQGQAYGGGIVTTPVREFFVGRQAIVFDIQIPKEMQLYKALNNRYPKDYAEFESAILKPAAIELPELPADKKYLYDPKTGELLVGPADQQ